MDPVLWTGIAAFVAGALVADARARERLHAMAKQAEQLRRALANAEELVLQMRPAWEREQERRAVQAVELAEAEERAARAELDGVTVVALHEEPTPPPRKVVRG